MMKKLRAPYQIQHEMWHEVDVWSGGLGEKKIILTVAMQCLKVM